MKKTSKYALLFIFIVLVTSVSCQKQEQTIRYSDGSIEQSYFLKNGEKDGKFCAYYEDGQIEATGYYRKGNMCGVWCYYYPNGNLKLKQKIRKGKTISIDAWDINGKQVVICGTGTIISYYPDMTKKSVISYKDCHIDGVSEGWYPNGVKEYECHYDMGKPIKTWRLWDEDGNLTFEEHY